MGKLHADEFAGMVTEGDISLRGALSYHLTANHYPPVPAIMVDACIEAIDNANEDEWDRMVALPEGVSFRGMDEAPTRAMIEQHHLESFLDDEGQF